MMETPYSFLAIIWIVLLGFGVHHAIKGIVNKQFTVYSTRGIKLFDIIVKKAILFSIIFLICMLFGIGLSIAILLKTFFW